MFLCAGCRHVYLTKPLTSVHTSLSSWSVQLFLHGSRSAVSAGATATVMYRAVASMQCTLAANAVGSLPHMAVLNKCLY